MRCPKCGTSIPIDDKVIIQRVRDQIQKDEEAKAEEKMKAHQAQFISDYKKRFLEEQSLNLKKIQTELSIKNKQIDEANERELKQIKLKTELEEKIKRQEIEIIKRVNEEKKNIEEKAQKNAAEKFELILAEERKKNESLQKSLREAEQKSRQGSMQTQGEVLELTLEELLHKKFPFDKISPVPKGVSGADIIHIVYNHQSNQPAGTIVWESKRTKNWNEEWVQKLKDDGRTVKADLCILVTEVLPREKTTFSDHKGIWICDYNSVVGVATALRQQLIAISNTMIANTNKDEKMETIYNYLLSKRFAQRVEAIVESFTSMQNDLQKEKLITTKLFAKREAQILRITENTASMYGEIQGIAGKALPDIKLLEMDTINEKEKRAPKEKETNDPQSNLFSD